MTDLEQWDWVNLGDDEGRVDRPSAGLAWSAPPEVELDDQWLVFPYPVRVLRRSTRAFQVRTVRASAGLLTAFITKAALRRSPPRALGKSPCVKPSSGGAISRATPARCSTRRLNFPKAA